MTKKIEKKDTFEKIRLARLEKIELDVEMRKIKLDEMRRERDYNSGCLLSVEDVTRAIDRVFEHPSGTCTICESKLKKLLHLTETETNEQEVDTDDDDQTNDETQN